MPRIRVRPATSADLDLLVRHRRRMWEAISDVAQSLLDAADPVYRRWIRTRLASGRVAGFIVEESGTPVASGCVWLMPVQPRPRRPGTTAAYLLSMFTEPGSRGRGHASRLVRASIRWARSRGVTTMLLHASRQGEPIYRALGFERTTEMRLTLSRTASRSRGKRTERPGPPRRRR